MQLSLSERDPLPLYPSVLPFCLPTPHTALGRQLCRTPHRLFALAALNRADDDEEEE